MLGDPATPPGSGLDRLCTVAVDQLRIAGAAVSLMTSGATRHTHPGTVSAASSDRARSVEELEFALGEGPGNDAFHASRPVLTPDLEQELARWPGYAPQALGYGVRGTFAFPLVVGAARFGVLHLHSAEIRTLSDGDIATSLMLAEIATQWLLDGDSPPEGPAPALAALLARDDRRAEVYQAQGMVMVDLGVSLPEALALIRAHAFATDRDLALVAADILARRIRLTRDPKGAS